MEFRDAILVKPKKEIILLLCFNISASVLYISDGYRGVAMVSAETPSENSVCPKFIEDSSCDLFFYN